MNDSLLYGITSLLQVMMFYSQSLSEQKGSYLTIKEILLAANSMQSTCT